MGALSLISKRDTSSLLHMPNGCFTVDPSGKILTSTLPQSFPAEAVRKIAQGVLTAFRSAEEAQMAFTELQIQYPALKITARELRGGAIVFFAPQSPAPTERSV